MLFEDIVKIAKEQNVVLGLIETWKTKMAISSQGKIYFDAKVPNFIATFFKQDSKPFSYSYKKMKIWLNKKDGNAVEFFFSFHGDTLLRKEWIMDIPVDEFVLLKQVLRIPDGFSKIYPFSVFPASEADDPWFSFSFNDRDGVFVPLSS